MGAYSWSLWGSAAFGSLADQAYHLELAREFEQAWRGGDFPPTWAAGANGGRGSVGFVVYPPFFAFLTACWMRLGASAVDSLGLAVLTAAGGAFGAVFYLARAWLSWRRSLLAAVMVLLLPGVTFPTLARSAPDVLFLRLLPRVLGLTFLAATEPGAWLLLNLPRFELVQFSWRWQLLTGAASGSRLCLGSENRCCRQVVGLWSYWPFRRCYRRRRLGWMSGASTCPTPCPGRSSTPCRLWTVPPIRGISSSCRRTGLTTDTTCPRLSGGLKSSRAKPRSLRENRGRPIASIR